MRREDYVDIVLGTTAPERSAASVSYPILAYAWLGQSNGFGMSPWPKPDPIDPDLLMLDPRCLSKSFTIPGTGFIASSNEYKTWRPAQEPMHNWLYPVPPYQPGQGGMSAIKPFGQRMRARFPHLQIALLCTARPSAVHALTSDSIEYQDTINTMIYARDVLGATLGGVVTHHGEGATGAAQFSDPWDEQYIDLIERMRVDTDTPDLAAVHCQLGLTWIHPGSEYWNDCKASQQRVMDAGRLSRARMVRTDTYSYYYDGVHNAAACNLREGYDAADAMADIGHPLFEGSPYSEIPQLSFSTGVESRTVIASGPQVITKIQIGELENSWITINAGSYLENMEVLLPPPYSTSVQITAGKVNPGPWMASFTIYDTLDRATPYLLEGRIGPS